MPSPPGLKSSIEYLAMSVGIGRTLDGRPLLDHSTNFRIDPKLSNFRVGDLTANDSRRITSGSRRSDFTISTSHGVRSGPGYLNRISASIGGASAGVKLPSGRAAVPGGL
jgi:hypothetical protein